MHKPLMKARRRLMPPMGARSYHENVAITISRMPEAGRHHATLHGMPVACAHRTIA